ncbi:hypothetical protein ACFL6C_02635 [Myxococcota bacterium]
MSRRLLVTCAVGFFWIGCDDGADGEERGVDSLSLDRALCGFFSRCEAELGKVFTSTERCVTWGQSANNCVPRLDNTRAEVDACISWLESRECTVRSQRAGPCALVRYDKVSGAREGGACHLVGCVGGHKCDWTAGAGICPVCVVQAGPGDSCTDSDECEDGLFCSNGKCTALKREGESCFSCPCVPGLFCDREAGTCTEPRPNGSPCSNDWECGSFWCREEVCLQFVAPSGACTPLDVCAPYTFCDGNVCAPLGNVGEPCEDFRQCLLDLACVAGECVGTKVCGEAAADDPCRTENECGEGLYCFSPNEVCTPFKADGTVCDGDFECSGGFCNFGGTPAVCEVCTLP